MDIFKCLRHRWVLLSIATCTVAFVIATVIKTSKEKAWTCFKNNEVVFVTLLKRMAIPLQTISENILFLDLELQGTTWKVAALNTASVGEIMAWLSKKAACPMIAVVKDQQEAEYLIVCGKDRQLSLSSVKHFIEQGFLEKRKEKFIPVPLSGNDPSEVGILLSQ